MKKFREGKVQVLVATDVASRGLDIPNVDLVVQIEPPKEVETYIHRSGRTARAGASGICITFYNNKNSYMIDMIESQAGFKFTRVNTPSAEDIKKATATGVLTNLEKVSDDMVPMFEIAAKKFVEKNNGNAMHALAKALAYISGNTSASTSG
jgi:ATP-dependent RNA helicase DDX21